MFSALKIRHSATVRTSRMEETFQRMSNQPVGTNTGHLPAIIFSLQKNDNFHLSRFIYLISGAINPYCIQNLHVLSIDMS